MTIYTKNNCVQCKMTERWLLDHGLKEFKVVNTSINHEGLAYVKSKGIKQLPYVETDIRSWSGFKPQELAKLVK
ncbi:glutaredoxin domain-containing protein [Oenococcus sicerae]|uniref:NrdH-redoxin n=1 Tax=Oenococcus sicerae TaxID=2203724 RepID=A0AAJ1R8M8_9LACO|nr:glutaredoxin domain-containing protein [Oenococcus sicerae]MDN6899560.1 NrdH-redoxin [Oenococcus sicerae]